MKRVGFVQHVSSSGNMILKLEPESLPRIGDRIVDENLKPVGVVFDIFGPVSSPYISVRHNVEEPNGFIRRVLYAVPSARRRTERRKR